MPTSRAARSRLMDVDIATESTHFAKHNILVQSLSCDAGPSKFGSQRSPATTRLIKGIAILH